MAESQLFVLIHGSKLQHIVGKGLHIAFGSKYAGRTIGADYTAHTFAHIHRYWHYTMRLCLNQTDRKSVV